VGGWGGEVEGLTVILEERNVLTERVNSLEIQTQTMEQERSQLQRRSVSRMLYPPNVLL
jgi:hypothetical protein